MSPQRAPQRFTHDGSTLSARIFLSAALSASVAFTSTIGLSFASDPTLQPAARPELQSMPSCVSSTPPNCHCFSVSSLNESSRNFRTSGASLFHHPRLTKYAAVDHESGSVYWCVVTSYHLAALPLPEPVMPQ